MMTLQDLILMCERKKDALNQARASAMSSGEVEVILRLDIEIARVDVLLGQLREVPQ